jgi:prepilin-type N-terminal cleavage/methylation domain-containing protein
MKTAPRSRQGQAGYTLVELIIAMAIGLFVATALTSVMLTSVRASNVAIGRIEASSQIRTFEMRAYDDFASSQLPGPASCDATNQCSTPIVLDGFAVTNATPPVASPITVTYAWDGTANLDRQVGSNTTHMATDVTAFSWYVDPASRTVVVQMTVTVLSYSESQTFVFHPRLNG